MSTYSTLFQQGSSLKTPAKHPSRIRGQRITGGDVLESARKLARKYIRKKRKFYGSQSFQDITPEHPDFQHFVEAAKLCVNHEVSFDDFIHSQIDGLKFINGGKGLFPRPCNLSTERAETRLLDYLRMNGHEDESWKDEDSLWNDRA